MKRFIFSALATAVFSAANAIPAKPGLISYTQPDGSVVNVTLRGDEFGHMMFTESNLLVLDVDGRLEYAVFDKNGIPVPSGILVSADGEKKISERKSQSQYQIDKWSDMLTDNRKVRVEKSLKLSDMRRLPTRADETEEDETVEDKLALPYNFGRYDLSFPVRGEQKGIVILVEYQDVAFKYGDNDYFTRMLNEKGFSDNGSLGSVKDWFEYNSNGQFSPQFDVFGPVKLPENRAYYGGNDSWGNDKNPWAMVVDACNILDDKVDFSQYDRNGDGVIDNVFLFYAGKGAHDSGIANAVWPHSYDITAAYPDTTFVYDGVVLDKYGCTCEYPSGYKRPDGIGTFIHEFSHVMGLPDLYVTSNYGNGFTPGDWTVMDQGPYNNDRLTPPNYSSYEKSSLGWLDLTMMPEGEVELPNLASSNVAYALKTDSDNEFYFFENRQQVGNDAFIPGHGMLVWHVDFNEKVWNLNSVNNSPNHQYVDLVEADNIKSKATAAGDAFPGISNVTSFGFNTTPSLASWSGERLAFDIEDIKETSDGLITFKAVAQQDNAVESIGAVNSSDGIYYDLTGRRVTNPSKGIYIVNGKKVVM